MADHGDSSDDDRRSLVVRESTELQRTQSRGTVIASVAISVGIIVGMLYFVVGLCS